MNLYFRHTCPIEVKGYPLWQIAIGGNPETGEKSGKARGIFAIGDEATGAIAIGYIAKGLFSLGLVSIGVVSIGLISIGAFSIGLLAVGLLIAKGLAAVALFMAVGKFAVAYNAAGGFALDIGDLIAELTRPNATQIDAIPPQQ